MTTFGSRDPATMNTDPAPYVYENGDRISVSQYVNDYDPRDEFTPTLTHEHNPALSAVRDDEFWGLEDGPFPMEGRIAAQLKYLDAGFGFEAANDGFYTPEQIDHARRVLTRLTNTARSPVE